LPLLAIGETDFILSHIEQQAKFGSFKKFL
jgi:hypothetical protein